MRITKATVDELNSILVDVLDDTGSAVRDAADTWLDEENLADERREAREILETEIDNLTEQVRDLLRLLSPRI
jgi:gas vesicle protein